MTAIVKSVDVPRAIADGAKGLTFDHADARGNYYFNCPVCGSHDNLGIKYESGKLLYYCWCGATRSQILAKLVNPVAIKHTDKQRKSRARSQGSTGSRVVKTYEYRDAVGTVQYRKLRLEPKDFRIEYRSELALKRGTVLTGEVREFWLKQKPYSPYQYYIYNYPGVLSAVFRNDLVFLVDGEKDADTLTAAGITATCVPFGNGTDRNPARPNLQPWAREQLSGADIAIIIDRDENGKGYRAALKQVQELYGQVVCFLEATHGKDTTDHYSAGGTVSTMRRLSVKEVMRKAESSE